jgi:outer membrane lipoprotein-sorting protein
MAPFSNDDGTGADSGEAVAGGGRARTRGRKAARYAVPVAVMGVAAATIGLVPALADSGDPDLPDLTAQELVAKMAASDTEQLSGTVKINTDLGLPDFGGLGASFAPGAVRGHAEVSSDPSAGDSADSSADPFGKLMELASGTHTLHIAADGPDKQKISVLENAAEYSLIRNGDEVWAYDSGTDEAYHRTMPKGATEYGKQQREHHRAQDDDRTGLSSATPQELAEQALKAADPTTSVTVDGTARVAGRDAYDLVLKPKAASGTTVGAVTVAVDAKTGTPLKFTLTPASGGAAVIDVGFTEVDFSAPSASTFDFKPPKGTKVTEDDGTHGGDSAHDRKGMHGTQGANGRQGLNGKRGAPGFGSGGADGTDRTHGGMTPRHHSDASGAVRGGGMETIGEGWTTIAHFDSGTGAGMPAGKDGHAARRGGMGDLGDMGGLLSSLGDRVKGDFGSGTLVKTRLVNALITDDGQVYAGAVTKDALLKAAESATSAK